MSRQSTIFLSGFPIKHIIVVCHGRLKEMSKLMRETFKLFFSRWWVPLIFFAVTTVTHVLSALTPFWTLQWITFYLFLLGWIGLLGSTVYHGLHRNCTMGLVTGSIFIGAIPAYLYFSVAMFFNGPSEVDTFADDLKIPTGIQICELSNVDFDGNRADSVLNILRTKTDFEIYSSFQPGLFEYDFWASRIDSGTIFLKAFEVTRNTQLSEDRLRKASSLTVFNETDSVLRFSSNGTITIYEGDWGQPYAARFEVWYKSSHDGQERKLIEKIYKIEGWQR